jgi:integrase
MGSFGEDGIYFDHLSDCQDKLHHRSCRGRWRAAVSVGYGLDGKRLRRKVSGATKREVRDKLRLVHAELEDGVNSPARYTLGRAIDDWLREGLDGRSEETVRLNRDLLAPVSVSIGHIPLRALTSSDVRKALQRVADSHSTRTVVLSHNALERAIRHAEANDHVRRNVASLIRPPPGQTGRPSKALTAGQTSALLEAAAGCWVGPYVILCLTVGIRTEEARALTWEHVDLDGEARCGSAGAAARGGVAVSSCVW